MLSMISAFVVKRWYCELTVILCSFRLMNWISSFLFLTILRNNCHWAPWQWISILFETRVLRDAVLPRWTQVWDLRLVSLSVSQMVSNLAVLSIIWLSRYGSSCISVYSPNTLVRWGLNIWTTAAMSRTYNCRSLSSWWILPWTRHPWKTTQDIRLGSRPKLPSIRQRWMFPLILVHVFAKNHLHLRWNVLVVT